jgi:septal ring-binding cell division protein DamX
MTRRTNFLLAALFLCGGCVTISGCGPKAVSMEPAVRAYEQGQWSTARTLSAAVRDRSEGTRRAEAAYLGGLSAFQLDLLPEAASEFTTARHGDDRMVAAMASAMLGQVRLRQGRPTEAAELLAGAWGLLPSDQKDDAAAYAAAAYQAAGNTTASQRWEAKAHGNHAIIDADRQPQGQFALQLGAWRAHDLATSAARNVLATVASSGLGPPRVCVRKDAVGQSLFVVQIGAFATRTAAAKAKERLPIASNVVVWIQG